VSLSLCNSYYDTKIYVYEDTQGNVPPDGCNDDNWDCVNPPVSYTSWIPSVQFLAGHTYYIVIDGYGGECGDYALEMMEVDCPIPCDVVCEGTPEGEPTCYENYEDHYNGGCNSSPPVYQTSWGNVTWCGESGVYETDSGLYRDTDWYRPGGYPTWVTLTAEAEFEVLFALVVTDDCQQPHWYQNQYAIADECVPTELTYVISPPIGDIVAFVAPSWWNPEWECGSEYTLRIEGDFLWCPVEPTSWSTVKALYR
jgi:hypothetical protein